MQKINFMPWIRPCDRRIWPAKHVSTLHQMPGFRRDDPFPKSVLPCHQKHYNCGNLLCLHNVEWQDGVCAVFSVLWLLSSNLCKHSWLGDQQNYTFIRRPQVNHCGQLLGVSLVFLFNLGKMVIWNEMKWKTCSSWEIVILHSRKVILR